jgi:hypothetical protein
MLIVETGAGLPDANGYVAIPYVAHYLIGEMLEKWAALSEGEQESTIIMASRYINNAFTWIGKRRSIEQGLLWPREEAVIEGFEITGVPKAVKEATAECVSLIMQEAELFSVEADVKVTSERVDVIQVHYAHPVGMEKTATKFEVLNRILRGLYRVDNSGGSISAAKVLRR